ncbi:hypothetical protein HDU97_003722 [Phlyctochytrium planicorne]|nr:hypothetical protein HDU97_003722 [Phlyctochytrium planicorne]
MARTIYVDSGIGGIIIASFFILILLVGLYFSIKVQLQKQKVRKERLALAQGNAQTIVSIPVDQLEKDQNGNYIPPSQVIVKPGQYQYHNRVNQHDVEMARAFS